MSDNQKHCAYCHAILFDDDDVVYCPECGAAHHRDCYVLLGECANKASHGLDDPAADEEDAAPVQPEVGSQSELPPVINGYGSAPGFGGVYSGIFDSEDIGGSSVRELVSFVRNNPERYIPLFKKIASGKRAGWNWAAFFFGPIWLFFRKCYAEGFIAVLFSLIVTVLNVPINLSMNTYIYENGITEQQLYSSPELLMETIPPMAWLMTGLGCLITLLIRAVLAVYGDAVYYSKAQKRISAIKSNDGLSDKAVAISMAGGCNVFSALGIYYAMQILSDLLLNLFV